MFEDRKSLIEQELANAKREAARLYFTMTVTAERTPGLMAEYEKKRAEISNLEFDLSVINEIVREFK